MRGLIEAAFDAGFALGHTPPPCLDEYTEQRAKSLSRLLAQGDGWKPTHRHIKRGTEYQYIARGWAQTEHSISDNEEIVIYQDGNGVMWCRPHREFFDGRFEPINSPHAQMEGGENG
jgi:hypothetical protein